MLVNQDVVMMRDKVNKGKKIHKKERLSMELKRLKTVADTKPTQMLLFYNIPALK